MGQKNKKDEQKAVFSDKKTVRLNFLQGDVGSLEPHELTPNSIRGMSLGKWIFEGLTRLDQVGKPKLAGAEKVEISSDKKRYTFTLRSNCYSDGTKVVARDYERAWKKVVAPDTKCVRTDLFYIIKNAERIKKGELEMDVLGIKAVDDQTLVVELEYPAPYFLNLLTLPIFSPFKMEGGKVLGSGPYQVKEWKRDNYMCLERNPLFWDYRHLAIEDIKILMIQDATTAFNLYENGDIDWVGDPICTLPIDILTTNHTPFVKSVGACPYWIHINTKHVTLSSPRIRQALSCVVDRNELVEHVLIGSAPLFNPLPKTLCQDVLANNDLSKGQKLFDQGLKELKLTKEAFPPITISCCSVDRHRKVAEYLQEKWQLAFGIKVHIDVKEWRTFFSGLQKGDYQIGGCFGMVDYDDPLAYFDQLDCQSGMSKWQSDQYEQVISQVKQAVDPEARQKLLREAEQIVKEEMPIIPLASSVFYFCHNPKIKGISVNHTGIIDLRWVYFEDEQSENRALRNNQ